MTSFEFTDKKYLFDTYLFHSNARVLSLLTIPHLPSGSTHKIILDSTIFHPQGGGQPSDIGNVKIYDGEERMEGDNCHKFEVKIVLTNSSNVVEHYGIPSPSFEEVLLRQLSVVGEGVVMCGLIVDEERRLLSARLHSAGHCLDVAMERLGFASRLKPAKVKTKDIYAHTILLSHSFPLIQYMYF